VLAQALRSPLGATNDCVRDLLLPHQWHCPMSLRAGNFAFMRLRSDDEQPHRSGPGIETQIVPVDDRTIGDALQGSRWAGHEVF